MLASENTAVIKACRFALMNAAPEEWPEKPINPDETIESPIRLLAEQISETRYARDFRGPRPSSMSPLRRLQQW